MCLIVFGTAVPPLLMMAPLFCWLYLCVLTWLEQNSNSVDQGLPSTKRVIEAIDTIGDSIAFTTRSPTFEDDGVHTGDEDSEGVPEVDDSAAVQLAGNLLVQQPIVPFWTCIHVGCYAFGMVQMLDLDFMMGPIILWTVLNTVAAALAFGMYRKVQAASRRDRETDANHANDSPKQHK